MNVAFAGHRPDKLGGYAQPNPTLDYVRAQLRTKLTALQAEHGKMLRAISGMALGFDLLAAEVCIELKIPFTAAVPFVNQQAPWSEVDRRRYVEIMRKAAWVEIICSGAYAAWKMQRRNEWMVDQADLLIACWDGSSGGTANCVHYATRCRVPIDRIWPRRIA